MQGLASGLVPQTPKLQAHLDSCLTCRSCERVCPAKVPYGELIDAGRVLTHQHRGTPQLTRRLSPWLTHAPLRLLAQVLLRAYQRSGLQALLRHSHVLRGRWARLESLLPARHERCTASIAAEAPRATATLPRLALFRGCVGEIADAQTLRAIRQLFEHCGFALEEPVGQNCCGALHQHAGASDMARQLARQNAAAFAGEARIIYAASGCGASLREYAHIERGDSACADFAARVEEPHQLLLQHWPASIQLQPLPARLAVHLPCTQRNVTGGGDAISALLKKIPQAEVLPLDLEHGCCGAAGTYFVSQPEMADRLLEHKLDALAALRPDYLLSSNIGCTLHLAAGLRRRGLTVPVLHPLTLLARQWPSGR